MDSQRIRFLWKSLRFRYVRAFSPLFISGVGGGGNTLLASLLHERYEVSGFADEVSLYAPKSNPVHVPSTRTFIRLKDFIKALEPPTDITPAQFREALVFAYRRYIDEPRNLPAIIDKSPNTSMRRAKLYLDAFPDSKMILVFREPSEHLEGLLRKWPLFSKAGIAPTVCFWNELHRDFIKIEKSYPGRIRFMDFATLLNDTEGTLSSIADFAGLGVRQQIRQRPSKPNQKGFALRNVVGGKIVVDSDHGKSSTARELNQQCESMLPVYQRLQELSMSASIDSLS